LYYIITNFGKKFQESINSLHSSSMDYKDKLEYFTIFEEISDDSLIQFSLNKENLLKSEEYVIADSKYYYCNKVNVSQFQLEYKKLTFYKEYYDCIIAVNNNNNKSSLGENSIKLNIRSKLDFYEICKIHFNIDKLKQVNLLKVNLKFLNLVF